VGVPHETIVEDYAISGEYLTDLFDELRVTARNNGYDSDWYDRLLLCQPDIMRHTLQYVDRQYGDITEYLLHTGVTREQLNQLRLSLVE
jgi:protein-tyrosine phosphatase